MRENYLCMGCVTRLAERWLDASRLQSPPPCTYILAEARLPNALASTATILSDRLSCFDRPPQTSSEASYPPSASFYPFSPQHLTGTFDNCN